VLPFVVQRESAGQGLFVTDLRPATALFARFTGLDYDNDERAAQALEALVSQAQLVLQRHGGVLLELTIGDKGSYLYGSFGAAQVHEDDASRALRAAMALRQFFSTSPYSVQIGLASGTMRVGGYGSSTRQSFGAMGDDVNFAARLMSIAQPGEILISGRVRQAVAAEFTLEARPPMPLRGKAEPLPVFAVMGLRQQRAIRLQEPAFALPMVGREAEMALLADRLSAALQGRGQILGITAEAGMGKSRLLAEGIRLARRQQWIGYGGTCQLDGIHTPYLVWQSIWTAFFDLDPALPLRKRIRSIESELEDRAPEHAEAWPLLGAVLGLELPDNDFTRALQPKDRKALLETVLLQCLA
jgi:class 3 adenylate cyclase